MTSQPGWVLGARGIPFTLQPLFSPASFIPRPYQHPPNSFLVLPTRPLSRFPALPPAKLLLLPYFALIRLQPLPPFLSLCLSFTPTLPAPFSPFFVISPPSLTPISLHPFITTPRVPTAAPSTSNDDDDDDVEGSGTALFLSRAPNKHEFQELA